jgi:polysaccharide biosynthesis protein PslH
MSARPRVLFLVHRVPFPPNRGDRIRSFHMLQELANHAEVTLGTLSEEALAPGTMEELQSRCQQVVLEQVGRSRWIKAAWSLVCGQSATAGLFHSSRLWKRLQEITTRTKFDAVVVFCSSMVPYLALPGLQGVPTIVDLVDVDSQKFYDYTTQARGLKRWLYSLEARRLRQLECTLPKRVQAITLVSEAEAQLYRSFCPNEKTYALGNGVDVEYFQPRNAPLKPFECVFIGALDYPPNIDGMLWFCNHVWPQVRTRYPKATLSIVGRNPTPALQKLAEIPGVEVVGTVPDVRPYLAQATVVVVPLRIARGIQNKVLEAMAMAKAVVTSPEAMEGLPTKPSEQLLVTETPEEWVKSIGRLFIETSNREKMGQAALEYVRTHHRWSDCLSPLRRLLSLSDTQNSKVAVPTQV